MQNGTSVGGQGHLGGQDELGGESQPSQLISVVVWRPVLLPIIQEKELFRDEAGQGPEPPE